MREFWDSWGNLVIMIWVALGSFVAGMEFEEQLNRMVYEERENE